MPIAFKQISISVLIVLILGVQAYIGLTYHGPKRWPFVSYPMYGHSRQEGDRISDFTARVVFADGREEALEGERIGMAFWILRYNIILPILRKEFSGDEEVLQQICAEFDPPPVRLDVYDIGVTVERTGAVFGEPMRRAGVELNCSAGE